MADPDRLVRSSAGVYRTADDRFEIRESGGAWFLVDTTQADELGQGLIHGPFATRKAAADALGDARRPAPTPLRKPTPPRPERARSRPAPPPPTWIDRLPKGEAKAVRSVIAALRKEGVADAEDVVRRDRRGASPEVVTRLIARRLDAIVDGFPERERATARAAVDRVAALLSREDASIPGGLPGWSLVEVEEERGGGSNRRITLPPE